MSAEHIRLQEDKERKKHWKKWGPYLTERQWGTVREDYSPDGAAWENVTHDDARSKAYRWGEEGIAGISDHKQKLCLAWGFWNGKDPFIKERLFGLTGNQGNHGEDVKEIYYYLDSTPTHSYMKMLYKYPQAEYPYQKLIDENRKAGKLQDEYELIDTGVFDEDRYFDIFIEYAKNDAEDIFSIVTVHNRGPEDAKLIVMPTVWFRKTWFTGHEPFMPTISKLDDHSIKAFNPKSGNYIFTFCSNTDLVFCNNETNREKLYGIPKDQIFCKDGINDFIVSGDRRGLNPQNMGTKAAAIFELEIPAGGSKSIKMRMQHQIEEKPLESSKESVELRKKEADEFYDTIQDRVTDADLKSIQRQAFAGLMWSKQFYYYDVNRWLEGDAGRYTPPEQRKKGRNNNWRHLQNYDIISMPDKWEYPWYAAWDLAFHCIPIARIDPEFAKDQLQLLLNEWYMHPNGQIPAYEWNFSDVNPPVHAYAIQRVYQIDKKLNGGKGDQEFLERAMHKLMLNFTWWVNQKDSDGKNIFEGGFLGLDNISLFDRSHASHYQGKLEQADGTSWMAMFSLNLLRISLDLCEFNKVYQFTATKFLEHFLYIAGAMNNISQEHISLWDDEDSFFYDVFHLKGKEPKKLKVRSIVGLIPLFAVEPIREELFDDLPEFKKRLDFFLSEKPKLAALVSSWIQPGYDKRRLFSLLRGHRMKSVLHKMLDSDEFLSDYGIRSLSKYYEKNPYGMKINGDTLSIKYTPGESDTRMFGGNSNWRGPIWFPINFLIIESLKKFDFYYGGDFSIEYPTGSGNFLTMDIIAKELSLRCMRIFMKDKNGHRPVYGKNKKFQEDPHFKDYILFYEYFHGDSGKGLGASHQTGWTALIAEMIHKYYKFSEVHHDVNTPLFRS
ncbi:Glycosyl hydrolase family 63 C-terminal domain-containing protein [Algoriphagus alkaliphilus]|uniref:Glycosyl hydrolase family 63 C-terminal domain-containing protein n=1 Tax=Algoriphagus alkaliphilus TaxID=279824 RepID=A0A1G5WCD0_9BACT|nr:glucosidase [Algoriphagus alkaliphilus]MBA4302539.1 glucosidase [Cyclobacterium sp.]SDA55781.1 Glycosyl hydrolase family 63 C-terminal domain-containing protein [Algoriphagus alkaliphilus]